MGIFGKKESGQALKKLENLRERIDKKIAQLIRFKKAKRIKDITRRKIDEGINKLVQERKRIVETIKKLSG